MTEFFPLPNHPAFVNITGRRFGELTVLGYGGKRGSGHYWACACSCGKSKKFYYSNLVRGKSTNCGCVRRARMMDGLKRYRERLASERATAPPPEEPVEKTCLKCGITKPALDFYRCSASKDRLGTQCSTCISARTKEWRQSKGDAYKEYARKQAKKWREANPKKRTGIELKSTYGITYEQYKQIAEQQGGRCAICGKTPEEFVTARAKVLCVDHNHDTGSVRGLLCYNCNAALGKFYDNPELLLKAAEYLLRTAVNPAVPDAKPTRKPRRREKWVDGA